MWIDSLVLGDWEGLRCGQLHTASQSPVVILVVVLVVAAVVVGSTLAVVLAEGIDT